MLSIWFVFLRSHSVSSSANKTFPLKRSKRVLCSSITCRIVHKWGLLPSRTLLACHRHPCCYPLLINFHLIGFDSVIFPTFFLLPCVVEHPCRILLAFQPSTPHGGKLHRCTAAASISSGEWRVCVCVPTKEGQKSRKYEKSPFSVHTRTWSGPAQDARNFRIFHFIKLCTFPWNRISSSLMLAAPD